MTSSLPRLSTKPPIPYKSLPITLPYSQVILDFCCSELWVSYETRRAAAKKMRKDTIQAITNNFNANLSKRGFTGSLHMNKDDRLLTLEVNSLTFASPPLSLSAISPICVTRSHP